MNRSLTISIGIIVFLVVILSTGLILDPQPLFPVISEKAIADFSVMNLYDQDKKITNQDLMGKIWLVNVWASWCESCRTEHPLLMQMTQENDIALFGLNYQDQSKDALHWLEKMGNPYQIIGADISGEVGAKLKITGTPESFILDQKGIIRFKQIGVLNKEIISKEILPIIEKLRSIKQ